MKRWIPLLAALLLACSTTEVVTLTSAPPQPAATAVVPPTAAAPAAPTPVPSPTHAPTPTAEPGIGVQNASRVTLLKKMDSPDLRTVVFSPDGNTLATSSGNQSNFAVQIWRATDGALLQTLDQFTGIVWDIAFSPDGQVIASVADDRNNQQVRIWQVSDGKLLQALNHGQTAANSLAFSPDGKALAVGGLAGWPNGMVWLYDTASWNVTRKLAAPGQNVLDLVFSPDGSTLISSGTDGNIRLWRVSDGALLRTLYYAKQANRVAISPNGALLASVFCASTGTYGCDKGGVVVWRVSDAAVINRFDDIAECAAFSPNGQVLVTGSGANDPKIRLRGVADWALLNTLGGSANSIAFSPDGAMMASTDVRSIRLWGVSK